MRVANGSVATILLVAAFALVLGAPPVVHARSECTAMIPDMQTGYRALERGQYTEADRLFNVANGKYVNCRWPVPENSEEDFRWAAYWQAYAFAGIAAANFGDGKIADGLKRAANAKKVFEVLMNGTEAGEGASESLRRAASDGIAYVRSLESAKKPLLPKIWLDWKAAHPSG
jgi:hypothetical protein